VKLFVEADSIARPKMSGVGHACLEMLRQLDAEMAKNAEVQVTAIIPFGAKKIVDGYGFQNIKIRRLWPGQKIINYVLTRTPLPLPVDIWFGRGTYIFPNYKNWYVPFSRSVTFVHDIVFKMYPETVQTKNRQYLEANFSRWLSRTDRVICISQSSADEVAEQFPAYKNKISAVHLGVDLNTYTPQSEAKIDKALKRYDLPREYFLFVGNIEPRKSIEKLFDAYKLYADKNSLPAALVLVGGDGWNNTAIKEKMVRMQDAGYAIHHPKTYVEDEDLPALYSGAKALVHVAIHEGFGITSLQAQACGTPVIVSDLPVHKETLDPGNATFVSVVDSAGIARAMRQVKRHKTNKTTLTWDSTIANLLSVIDNLTPKQEG
jgi:glycosyltransferase involved in cell wall biosynthesis